MMIRRAVREDARAIADIHVRTWQVGYQGIVPEEFLSSLSIDQRELAWREGLERATSEVWVAEDSGAIRGWISAARSRDSDASPTTAELWAIYVDPAWWRRGLGRALWQVARDHLAAAGFTTITLWLLEQNQRALAFYRSLFFELDPAPEQFFERAGARLREIRLRRTPL
jgi:ribosomal protein S18 acetylase RimI-like enzyme